MQSFQGVRKIVHRDISETQLKPDFGIKWTVLDRGLQLFFAIDPTDGASGRDRLADLPSQLSGHNFGDGDVRAAGA